MGILDLFKHITNSAKPQSDKHFRSDIERQMYETNAMGYREKKDRLDYQNDLLNRINKANDNYKIDGNIDALIKEYEFAFIESDPPCHSSQNLKLVDLYLKSGLNNKAWSYLNHLYASNEAPKEKIRHEQARILKKEKRYIPALEMIMTEHLLKYSNSNGLNKEAFLREAGICTRALKWNETTLNDLAGIVEKQIKLKQSDYDEVNIHKEYEAYLKQNGLLKEG